MSASATGRNSRGWKQIPFDEASEFAPILFNRWKHHAGFLRSCISAVSQEADLPLLASRLTVIGTALMDLYHGPLPPAEIASAVIGQLVGDGHFPPDAFQSWVEAGGGHRVVTLGQDESRWVLRLAPPPRYVHLHPGRYSPHTRRVRAPVLKTAVLVLAHVRVHGGDPLDHNLMNVVRREYLDLPPLGKAPSSDRGLGSMVALLRPSEAATDAHG